MLRSVQDHSLPPDHQAFVASSHGRIIVIAPTRAACETIEISIGLRLETYLERTHGERVRELARGGRGFGIVAGTGTGKTLAIRPIAEEILQATLRVGVVNREREATAELAQMNVVVVTTGVARRWFQDGDILPHDTLIVDEIHQTSAELELCLALGNRVGCRFIWLSATVDSSFYRRYLNSADVLEVFSFDEEKAATVKVVDEPPLRFLNQSFLRQVVREKRGVGVFVPTRAGVEQAAAEVARRSPRIHAAYYHGGEPIRAIRPFLEDDGAPKPYLLAMTAAGQSALNVQGLDTVVIEDARFTNVIEGGRNILTRLHLGNNEILQMAGRVHGRVAGGRVFILSDRQINFKKLRPTAPEFQLAGDSERVALTCADLGVRADDLELPVPLDRIAYRRAFDELQQRNIIDEQGKLSSYGKKVEALPVDRAWAELIVNADEELLPYLAVMSSVESLHRMTRDERYIDDLVVRGSDHLTAYNVYADAYQRAGYIGEVHGLPRHLFDAATIVPWAQERGVLLKSVEEAALAMASLFRSIDLPLAAKMPLADAEVFQGFTDLVARFMPFDLVIDETTSDGRQARVSKTSVCGRSGAVAGTLRYFADRYGTARAGIEGTQIPFSQLRRYVRHQSPELDYTPQRKHAPLSLKWKTEYFGFELESRSELIKEFPPELARRVRSTLAQALACGEAHHAAVHQNRAAVDEIRELHRRSGGQTPRLNQADLTALYERQLNEQQVHSLLSFRAAPLPVRVEDFVPTQQRQQLLALPSMIDVGNHKVSIDYEIEEQTSPDAQDEPTQVGVARLHLPQKLARALTEKELPQLDRPLRFIVTRGQRGNVRADTLSELQELLERPGSANGETTPRKHPPKAKAASGNQSRGAKQQRQVRKQFGRSARRKKR